MRNKGRGARNKERVKKNTRPLPEKKRRRNLWTAVVFPFLLFTFLFGGTDALLLQDAWSLGIAFYLVFALNGGIFFPASSRFRLPIVSAVLFLAGFFVVLFVIPPVRIAKETTFLTGPKTADGLKIDYERTIKKPFAFDPDDQSAESFFTKHKEEIPMESPIRLLNRLMENPWSEEDCPLAKRWLDQVELAEIPVSASQGRDFRIRIQYELGRRNPDQAWDDVLTLFRLSQHLFREIHETSGFFNAQALWNDAFLSAIATIQYGDFSAEQLQSKLAELEPFLNTFSRETGKAILDTGRLLVLARIQATAWGENPAFSAPYFGRFLRFFHWNETLKKINAYFDWIEILEAPSYSWASRFPVRENSSEWSEILKRGIFRAVPDRKGILEIRVWSDKASFLEQQLRILRTKGALLRAAFYLEIYRKEQDGKYPANWAELKSKYGGEIPDDPCNAARSGDRSFKYQSLEDGAGYRLYSIGPNEIDENGATWLEKKGSDDIEIGTRGKR